MFCRSQLMLQSQSKDDSVVNVINSCLKIFKATRDMSFDVNYSYSNESTPTVILDSLSRKIQMHGAKYHFFLDSTETIRNEHYTIVLFLMDKINVPDKGHIKCCW